MYPRLRDLREDHDLSVDYLLGRTEDPRGPEKK